MSRFLILMILAPVLAFATPARRAGFSWDQVKLMAIQDRGRLKPLETFANESVLYVTGSRKWNGMSAVEVVFGWLFAFDKEWNDEAFIRIDHQELKKLLGLDADRKYFTIKEIETNGKIGQLAREAMRKEERKERANDLDKKVLQVQNQRGLLEAVTSGRAWTILPNPEGMSAHWFSLGSLSDMSTPLPYSNDQGEKLTASIKSMIASFLASDSASWNSASTELARLLSDDLSKGAYPSASSLSRESHYNNLHPFRWAWILYTLAFIGLLFFNVTGTRWAKVAGLATLLGAFSLHAYGFTIRCLIAGRPPVTNMYESVIWVTWGCVAFSLLIWLAYKNAVIPTAAVVFAIVGLIIADNVPVALDPSINPLEPVLRSNYWLTIHVLTITLSYAAFALSLCLGNVVLGNFLFRPKQTATIQNYSLYMYRAMQIGVVLLASGTILGGVWADYSWGRFWGWDPKEVWALIALLLYLAVLHGRFTGWLKGFGFATAAVMSFLGVLMAWYGVNFVLGVGLHSYGFGTGGLGWVSAGVLLQLGFVAAAYRRYHGVRAAGGSDPAIFPPRR